LGVFAFDYLLFARFAPMGLGMRHHHKNRKTLPVSWRRLLDWTVYTGGILGPIFTLPQIYQIFHYHTAAGVSAFSWFFYSFAAVFWFIYGLVHKDKAIAISYFLWVIVDFIVAVGAIIYAR